MRKIHLTLLLSLTLELAHGNVPTLYLLVVLDISVVMVHLHVLGQDEELCSMHEHQNLFYLGRKVMINTNKKEALHIELPARNEKANIIFRF